MNQYTSRTLPGGADVIGTANASSTVTVNDQPTYRKGEYFWRELTIGNEWVPVCQSITNLAVLNDSPDPDIVTNSTGNVLLPATPETFLHDLDGNLVRDGLWTNTWNGENRLVRTESLSTVPESARARVDWTYLPDGRWIERIVSTWVSGDYVPQSTNRFVWDGQVLLGILGEDNAATLSFMRGLDLSGTMQGAGGVGGLLAVADHSTSEIHFVGNDGNGNVTLLINAANAIESARYIYSPYGETLRCTGEMAKNNPIRFSTQFADAVSGDAKYLFREYRPTTGRWLSRDPLEDAELIEGPNLYIFNRNNPINRIDTDGRGSIANPANAAIAADALAAAEGTTVSATGLGIGATAATALHVIPDTLPDDKEKDKCKKCPECKPYKAGTRAYQVHRVPPSEKHGPWPDDHLHWWRVEQNPNNCKCYWRKDKKAGAPWPPGLGKLRDDTAPIIPKGSNPVVPPGSVQLPPPHQPFPVLTP